MRDPVGYIDVGMRSRIPFALSEADIDAQVILLTEYPVVRLSVETPDGVVVDEGNASSFGVTFDSTTTVKTARFALPVPNVDPAAQAGTWHAVLEVDDDSRRRVIGGVDRAPTGNQWSMSELRNKGARYCLSVHALSNLRMQVSVGQDGFVPGSKMCLEAYRGTAPR